MEQIDIINRISNFRYKKKLSARELSLQLGKSENYINKLECYDFNLTIPMFLEILKALEITEEDFFGLAEQYNEETKTLMKNFNKLSTANKQTVIDLVNKLQ